MNWPRLEMKLVRHKPNLATSKRPPVVAVHNNALAAVDRAAPPPTSHLAVVDGKLVHEAAALHGAAVDDKEQDPAGA